MPNVDRDPNCQTTRYEGQDGYALVDAAHHQALQAEVERLRAELALLWRDPARECAGCGSIPAGKAPFWCGECAGALRADAERYRKALERIHDAADCEDLDLVWRIAGWAINDAAVDAAREAT